MTAMRYLIAIPTQPKDNVVLLMHTLNMHLKPVKQRNKSEGTDNFMCTHAQVTRQTGT